MAWLYGEGRAQADREMKNRQDLQDEGTGSFWRNTGNRRWIFLFNADFYLLPPSFPSPSLPLRQICVTKMSTRSCQGTDSVIKPLDTIPEDKKVRVQRTQSGFDPFEKPASQVKRVHSENNACINAKSSSAGKESPKLRRHSSPSSVSRTLSTLMF